MDARAFLKLVVLSLGAKHLISHPQKTFKLSQNGLKHYCRGFHCSGVYH